MEFRVLQYFLAVTREQSISGAAESLHLSQPTLSRQLKDLEDELGKPLFVRGNRKITLTEEGMILRKHAEEITELMRKAEDEITQADENIAGDVCIGAGETDSIRLIARAAKNLRSTYPDIHFRMTSGDGVDVMERLDRGLIDFGLVFEPGDLTKYDFLNIPVRDVWGFLMRKDSPLAAKEVITAADIQDQPLLISRQVLTRSNSLTEWFGRNSSELNIISSFNLVNNAALMVDEGLGYALTLDKIINVTGDCNLVFRPLSPRLEISMSIIWKKYQILPKAAEKFLLELKKML